jgi:hypothetical protein
MEHADYEDVLTLVNGAHPRCWLYGGGERGALLEEVHLL